jgi:hypothetical protein
MARRPRLCAVCEVKPARKLESVFRHAMQEAAFCSRKCAAEYGLLIAGGGGDDGLNWCETHGWFTNAFILDDGCPVCSTSNPSGKDD